MCWFERKSIESISCLKTLLSPKDAKRKIKIFPSFTSPKRNIILFSNLPISSLIHIYFPPTVVVLVVPHWIWGITGGKPKADQLLCGITIEPLLIALFQYPGWEPSKGPMEMGWIWMNLVRVLLRIRFWGGWIWWSGWRLGYDISFCVFLFEFLLVLYWSLAHLGVTCFGWDGRISMISIRNLMDELLFPSWRSSSLCPFTVQQTQLLHFLPLPPWN